MGSSQVLLATSCDSSFLVLCRTTCGMALTDISGIGSKTAETLREEGITSKDQLLRAYKENDRRVIGGPFDDGLNNRALEGIRDELAQQESFVDPIYGVPVTEGNEQARETFDLQLGSDVASGFGDFTRDKPGVDAGMNVLEAAGEALQGNLGPMLQPESYEEITPDTSFSTRNILENADDADRATKEAFEWATDAAANLAPFNQETIESGNELARQTAVMGQFTVQQETTEMRETSEGEIEATEKREEDFEKIREAVKDILE